MRWTPWWEDAILYTIYNSNLQKRARFRGNGKKGEKKRICMNVRRTAASTSLDQADRLWDAKRQGKQIAADNATTGRVSRDHRAGNTYVGITALTNNCARHGLQRNQET